MRVKHKIELFCVDVKIEDRKVKSSLYIEDHLIPKDYF